MLRLWYCLLLISFSILNFHGVASAAPGWVTSPLADPISQSGQLAESPFTAIDSQGNSIVVWRGDQGGAMNAVYAALRPTGGPVGAANRVSVAGQNVFELQVDSDAQGERVAAVWRQAGGIYFAQGTTKNGFSAAHRIETATLNLERPDIAIAQNGELVVSWLEVDGGTDRARAVLVDADGSVGQIKTFTSSPLMSVSPRVEMAANGTAIVSWAERPTACIAPAFLCPRIGTVMRSTGNDFDDTPHFVESDYGDITAMPVIRDLQAAVSPQGRAYFGWSEGSRAYYSLLLYERNAGSGVAGKPAKLKKVASAGMRSNIELALQSDGGGNLVSAWRFAYDMGGGSFSGGEIHTLTCLYNANQESAPAERCNFFLAIPVTAVAGNDAKQPSLTTSVTGAAAIGWQEKTSGGDYTVRAVRRGPASLTTTTPVFGIFSPIEVLGSDTADSLFGTAVGIDTLGNTIAWWRAFTGGGSELRAAGYDSSGPVLNNLSVPTSLRVGQQFQATVSLQDLFASNSTVIWDFGDGESSTGTAVTHVYTQPGVYTVRITAEDDRGLKRVLNEEVRVVSLSGFGSGNDDPLVPLDPPGPTQPPTPRPNPVTTPQLKSVKLSKSRFCVAAKKSQQRRCPKRTLTAQVENAQQLELILMRQVKKNKRVKLRQVSKRTINLTSAVAKLSVPGVISPKLLRPGRYILRLRALDSTTRRSEQKTVSFTVIKLSKGQR